MPDAKNRTASVTAETGSVFARFIPSIYPISVVERSDYLNQVFFYEKSLNQWLYTDNFSSGSPSWQPMLYALLGNKHRIVKPWYLPFDWIFVRVLAPEHRQRTIIVRNKKIVPNIYAMPVLILNGRVFMRVPDHADMQLRFEAPEMYYPE
jgi:hypothetical protein